jgi:hypothetical protein
VQRSEAERRGDELGKQSDRKESVAELLALPAQRLLLLLELLELLYPDAASCSLPAAPNKLSSP